MSRPRRLLTAVFVLSLISFLHAQDPVVTASGDTITAPSQLRQVAPPEPSLTAQELEERADALRMQKAYADALDYYRAALAKKETSTLHNKVGISQLQLLRHDDARKSFQRALKLDKRNAEARNNLGVIYYIQQNYRKAVKEYRKAIEVKQDSASFYSNLGTAEFSRKEYQKASDAYLRALEIDPDVFERRSNSGVQMHMASPTDRAGYHYTIAKMFAAKGDADRCLLYLRKAMEEGYPDIAKIYKENEFSGVRKDPRFTALMEQKPLAIPQ
ncbi:MAG TPA: tetratricopeptide repeat protein [Terriglobales bacterium]|nr:tetratricopeptide repeat protein [Terriglobales bacterium]